MSESSTESEKVYTAQIPGADDAALRTVVLAHPLTREADLTSLGLAETCDPEVGIPTTSKVRVRRDHAEALIGAGYAAGVSPDKPEQVREVVVDDKFGTSEGDQPQDGEARTKTEEAGGEQTDSIEQPTEPTSSTVVAPQTGQADAPTPDGTIEAPGAGATGDTDASAPATATSGDGAAAAKATQAAKSASPRAGR